LYKSTAIINDVLYSLTYLKQSLILLYNYKHTQNIDHTKV